VDHVHFTNEQGWLPLMSTMFDGVVQWRQKRVNVATYNVMHYGMRKAEDGWCTDGGPLTLFHYSGYDVRKPNVLSAHATRYPPLTGDMLEFFEGYAKRVLAVEEELCKC
jgi:hypothetical protein